MLRMIPVLALAGTTGCALMVQGTSQAIPVDSEPPGALVTLGGEHVTTPGTIHLRRRGDFHVARASAPGYQDACRVLEGNWNKGAVVAGSALGAVPLALDAAAGSLTRYSPEALRFVLEPGTRSPLPSDEEIVEAWSKEKRNLCASEAQQQADLVAEVGPEMAALLTRARELIVTSGDVNQRYEILGNVRVDTTERSGARQFARDMFRPWIAVSIAPTPKGRESEMIEELRLEAVIRYRDDVDAVINANAETDNEGDVFASGLAVRFLDEAAPVQPVADPRPAEDRLRALEALYRDGLVTPAEYERKRDEIIDGM